MKTKDLRSFTPTLSQLLGIASPELAGCEPFEELCQYAGRIRKALIYCPDAFGVHALSYAPNLQKRVRAIANHEVELLSVFPPKTPVCFASLFTGGSPDQHGIRHYEKPVLSCDTIFDALLRAGKRVAIVSVRDSSVDKIFRGRKLDYFSMSYDPLVTSKALELLKSDEHDVIIVYHQEYDDLLHSTGPLPELALKALERHTETWEFWVRSCGEIWKEDFVVAFAPDHGGHLDPTTGRGEHGVDMPEDMNLRYFFRIG